MYTCPMVVESNSKRWVCLAHILGDQRWIGGASEKSTWRRATRQLSRSRPDDQPLCTAVKARACAAAVLFFRNEQPKKLLHQ